MGRSGREAASRILKPGLLQAPSINRLVSVCWIGGIETRSPGGRAKSHPEADQFGRSKGSEGVKMIGKAPSVGGFTTPLREGRRPCPRGHRTDEGGDIPSSCAVSSMSPRWLRAPANSLRARRTVASPISSSRAVFATLPWWRARASRIHLRSCTRSGRGSVGDSVWQDGSGWGSRDKSRNSSISTTAPSA
jgi:hypothetical protein